MQKTFGRIGYAVRVGANESPNSTGPPYGFARRVRNHWLRSQGFRILRYWNNEIFDEWDTIAEAI
jgi:hypothetical protein